MKTKLIAMLAGAASLGLAYSGLAQTPKAPLTFAAGAIQVGGSIELAEFTTGKWTTPKGEITQTGNEFSGTFETTTDPVKVWGEIEPSGTSATCTINWTAKEPLEAGIILNLWFAQPDLVGASISSEAKTIKLENVENKSEIGALYNVETLQIGPVGGNTLKVKLEAPSKTEALFYKFWTVRAFLVGAQGTSGETLLPETGRYTFTLETNGQ